MIVAILGLSEVAMAGDELEIVRLRNDYYRDGFYKVFIALAMIALAVFLSFMVFLYLFLAKPSPITFTTDNDWRAFAPVPLDQPYLRESDLLQWVSTVLPPSLTVEFTNYAGELDQAKQYYTEDGWKKFLDVINIYANQTTVSASKLFVNVVAAGAPVILNKGILVGRYGWWIQMPLNFNYLSIDKRYSVSLVMQVLVVRTPTVDNLSGIAIDNVVVAKGAGSQGRVNG